MGAADRLRGGRAIAARGHLSLDHEKARQKLRMFRLPDPHFYVLQFVRAASVLGARRIDFEISASEMTCSFDETFSAELLEDIWGVAFEARTDAAAQAVHYLALGVGSAQALNPAYIDVRSGDVSVRFEGETEAVGARGTGVGTVIFVKEKFRFGHIVEFFTSISGKLPETLALQQRCSFSPLEVRVNGQTNRVLTGDDFSQYQVTFSEEDEQGFVALEYLSVDGWCEVLKDGVALRRVQIPNHGKAAIGAMQSTRVQTDLSGLALIQSEGWDRPLHDVFIPHYHQALLRWLRTIPRDDVADQLNALAELADYAGQREGALSKASVELLERLCDAPLFENALEAPATPSLSINDAMSPTLVRYSMERFEGVKTRRHGDAVLLVEPSNIGVADVHERTLRESVMLALESSRVRGTVNVTLSLERAATAARNRALWRARPEQPIGGRRYERCAKVGPRHGVVYLPIDAANKGGRGGFFIYRESKLVRHHESTASLAVEVDGQLGLNEQFDDVIRDQDFTKLGVELCAATLDLHQKLARDLLASGAAEHARPRILDRFVLSLCRGDWCRDFFAMLGYLPATQVPTILEEHAGELAELTWFEEQHRHADLIERLGAIAEVPSIELADGSSCSLAEALRHEDLSLLQPSGDWRAFISKTRTKLGAQALSTVAIVDSVQEALLRRLRPVPDARVAVERLRARARYFAAPEFVIERPANVAREVDEHSNWFDMTLMLVPNGQPNVCLTTFVWHSRVLGQRHIPVPMGSFEAIVSSDEFRPTFDFEDIDDDQRVGVITEFLSARTAKMLDVWWNERRRSEDLGTGAPFDLFVDVAHELAPKIPERAIIPVLQRDGDGWRTELVSRKALRAAAAKHGLVMSYTRTDQADQSLLADPEGAVIRLGSRREPAELDPLVGQKLRLVDATPAAHANRGPSKVFWEKSKDVRHVEGAAFEWSGLVRGLTCTCGLYHDPNAGLPARIDVKTATAPQLQALHGIGPSLASAIILFRGHQVLTKPEDLLRVPGIGPVTFEDIKGSICVGDTAKTSRASNLVAVLLHGRQLESLDVETPMGKFRTTMSGEAIVPDPTYTFAAGGREKVLFAAHEVAAKTIREACRAAREVGAPVAELVPDLRGFLARCLRDEPPPPFDVGAVLRSTPLFETLAGNRLTYDELPTLINNGVLLWADEGDRDDIVRLAPKDLAVAQAALGDEVELRRALAMWSNVQAPQPSTAARTASSVAPMEGDPVLDTVVDLLIEARADQVELFDDHLAARVSWAPTLEKTLCRVSRRGVDVNPHHAVVRAVQQHGDFAACAFLASAVYSAVNAYYREITDHDELTLQSRLVRCLDE